MDEVVEFQIGHGRGDLRGNVHERHGIELQ